MRATPRLLTLVAVLVVLAAIGLAPGFQPTASADCEKGDIGGVEVGCGDTVPTDPGDPTDPGGGGGGSGGGSDPRECTSPGHGSGLNIPCTTEDGVWNDARMCYEKVADPQPPKSDPVWDGNDEGYIVSCTPSKVWCETVGIPSGIGGAACLTPTTTWQPRPPGAPPVDPEAIARRAFARLGLEKIDIGIVPEDEPGRVGLVGMPTWMWAQNPADDQVGPMSTSATDQGLTVTLDARVDRVVWDMGDGTTVTCTGPGTPYQDSYGKKESPDCGYVYTRQGEYQVTATTYWVADWTGGGESGQLTTDFAAQTTITVGELQVLTQ